MKRFKARNKKNYALVKIIFCLIIVVMSFFYTIKFLFQIFIKVNDEKKVNEMLAISTNNLIGNISFLDLVNFNLTSPDNLLKVNLQGFKPLELTEKKVSSEQTTDKRIGSPLVYIYNTHQTEEYAAGSLATYNITPTVYMASFILKKTLLNYQINAIVEESNLKTDLNNHGWNYNKAYYISEEWLYNAIKKYPTLKYFIDLHRDSVSETITINNLTYAKMMFVIGTNHEHYKENEALVLSIYQYLNEHYQGVMKETFYRNNSDFNQNFNVGDMLIEIGGPDNTIDEIYNSTLIFAEALANIIGGKNG